MKKNKKQKVAGAICSAMGAETIQKSAVSPKNQRSRGNQLKKVFFVLITLIGLGSYGFGQNTVVIQNDTKPNNTQDQCPFRINGICSSEDIGGVEFEKITTRPEHNVGKYKATNYNNVAVTVLVQITYYCSSYQGEVQQIITKVLKPNESKWLDEAPNCNSCRCKLESITRKL